MSQADENLLSEWARLLLGTLVRSGVRRAVISPGSRSTPFTWAALETPELFCHSVTDERSAAFFALGFSRLSGRPSLLICTSGTAPAHYLPAVIEASESHLPLLLLTADRPFELQAAGASQTIDQVKLFGSFVRGYLDLGNPDPSPQALLGLERMAVQAVATSLGPSPGPFHLNARARKPLDPLAPRSDPERALQQRVTERLAREPGRIISPAQAVPAEALERLVAEVQAHPRGVIACGPMPPAGPAGPEAVVELSRAAGYPLLAEAASQVRFGGRKPDPEAPVLGSLESALAEPQEVELLLGLGGFCVSSAFERFLTGFRGRYLVVSGHGHVDPLGRADLVLHVDPSLLARELSRSLRRSDLDPREPARAQHRARLVQRDKAYFEALDRAPKRTLPEVLDEATAVRTAVSALPDGGLLGLGNSLPIREVDRFVPPGARRLQVWSQRGASGIDGLVSGAVGAAVAAGTPSLCLLGDVSFLHDLGGLALARELTSPLALVVLDNGGGRIFDELPIAERLRADPERRRYWLTPPGLDLGHAAALFGIRFAPAVSEPELSRALSEALGRPGCTLISARVSGG